MLTDKEKTVIEAAKNLIDNGGFTVYSCDEDSVGYCAVCGETLGHAEDCALVKLRSAIKELEKDQS